MTLSNTCTLVTAFYNFPEKKHSSSKYLEWIANFLCNCDNYMIIYTNDKETADILYEYRNSFLSKTKIIIEPIIDFYTYKYIEKWHENVLIDHERRYHNPNLYMIWNEKTMFMYKSSKYDYFNTEFYAWVDIGMIRNTNDIVYIKDFPNKERLENIRRDKVYLLEVEDFEKDELNYNIPTEEFKYKNRCGGGMILCSINIIEIWVQEYYSMLNEFMNKSLFAGKDQSIMNNIYIKYNSDLIELVKPINSPIDKWFYMIYFLSNFYYSP